MSDIERRRIGPLEVSLIGLGTNSFGRIDLATTRSVIDAALDCGVTFLDTADAYASGDSERFIGDALRGRRDRVVLATKFAAPVDDDVDHRGAGAGWIHEAVDRSLRRLQTDYIDLYQQHRFDGSVPLEETLGALNEVVASGKVRAIGCSNFTEVQLEAADSIGRSMPTRYLTVQNELNLVKRDALDTVIPACERLGMGFLPYYPLASGLLTGKYRRGVEPAGDTRLSKWGPEFAAQIATDSAFDVVERVSNFATRRGYTLLELSMAWLAAQPTVTSIVVGASKPEQVIANAEALRSCMTPDERDEVTAIATGRS